MCVVFVATVLCGELAELSRRQKSSPLMEQYLRVRAGQEVADVFLPLTEAAAPLMLDVADEQGGEEDDSQKLADALAGVSARRFEAIKIASLCSALPQAMFKLQKLRREPVLVYHLDEALMERTLKKTKASVRAGNLRSGLMDAVSASDQHDAVDELRAALRTSHRWEGEGVCCLAFGVCYVRKLSIASWNLIEALKLSRTEGILSQNMFFAMRGAEIDGFCVIVGTQGATVRFCACGDPSHQRRLVLNGSAVTWYHFSDALFAHLAALQPVPPAPQDDGRANVETLVSDLIEDALGREQRRATQERNNVVLQKLNALGFGGEQLTATMLRDFRDHQADHLFDGDEWPNTKEAQIQFLFKGDLLFFLKRTVQDFCRRKS
jgi:hypothetical protein